MVCPVTRCITNDDHSAIEHAEAEVAMFSVVSARVGLCAAVTGKYPPGIIEVQLASGKGLDAFGWIVGDPHDSF